MTLTKLIKQILKLFNVINNKKFVLIIKARIIHNFFFMNSILNIISVEVYEGWSVGV